KTGYTFHYLFFQMKIIVQKKTVLPTGIALSKKIRFCWNYFPAGMMRSLSPSGMNSLRAPFAIDFLGDVKSKERSLSAKATFMSGLVQKASPLAACGAWAIPAYSGR